MAITVTHSTVGVAADDGVSEIGKNEWNANHTIVSDGGGGFTNVTSSLVFYVRTDGNDNNDGLANTAGSAWRTIEGAAYNIAENYFNMDWDVTVNVAAGTYTVSSNYLPNYGKAGYIYFKGNSGDHTAVTIATTNYTTIRGYYAFWYMTLQTKFNVGGPGSFLELYNVTLTGTWGGDAFIWGRDFAGGDFRYITINGTAASYIKSEFGSFLKHDHNTLTIVGDPGFPSGCLNAHRFGYIHYNVDGGLTGTSSGPKFFADQGSFINMLSNVSEVPGATFGSVGSGSQIAALDNVYSTTDTMTYTPQTYASLPTGVEGMVASVTDSNTNTWGATIAGSGANKVLAYYNGTNWTVAGK